MSQTSPDALSRQSPRRTPRRRGALLALLGLIVLLLPLGVVPASSAAEDPYVLRVSQRADRAGAIPLAGSALTGSAFVFLANSAPVTRVDFYLDDAMATGTPVQGEKAAPYDFRGGTVTNAVAWDTRKVADGAHTITAKVSLPTGAPVLVTAGFTVVNGAPALTAQPSSVSLSLAVGAAPVQRSFVVSVSDGSSVAPSVSSDAAWLRASAGATSTSTPVTLTIDPAGLRAGSYTGMVDVSRAGAFPVTVPVTLAVTGNAVTRGLRTASVPTRAGAIALQGASLIGDAYVFLESGTTGVDRVEFRLDTTAGTPFQSEKTAPYDLRGGTVELAARWDTRTVSDGPHTLHATTVMLDGTNSTVSASFSVDNGTPRLSLTPATTALSAPSTGPPAEAQVQLTTGAAAVPAPTAQSSVAWLRVSVASTSPGAAVLALRADPTGQPAGVSEGSYSVSVPGYAPVAGSVRLTVEPSTSTSVLRWSTTRSRTSPAPLEGAVLTGQVYPYLAPAGPAVSVAFYVDDTGKERPPLRTDGKVPFDLGGSNTDGTAKPWDSAVVPDGTHTLTAVVSYGGGLTESVSATFATSNGTNGLAFSPQQIAVNLPQNGTASQQEVVLQSTRPVTAALTTDAGWLSVAGGATVATPAPLTLTVDPAGLAPGAYSGRVVASAAGVFTGVVTVSLVVGEPSSCAPLACELIKVPTPYSLNWFYDSSMLLDKDGTGSGFTHVLQPDGGGGYDRSKIDVDPISGTLSIATGPGGFADGTQENALGVGFDGPLASTTITATVTGVPPARKQYEQAGIWFGYSQDDVVKFTIQSTAQGWRLEHLVTVGGVNTHKSTRIVDPTDGPITFNLVTDPAARKVKAVYSLGTGGTSTLSTASVPGEFFSFDGAGLDPRIGTRSFAGILASHRAGSPMTWAFSEFGLSSQAPAPAGGEFAFDRVSHASEFPTAMAFGPDGNLYTTDLFGGVHRLTIGPDHQVVSDQRIGVLGSRLALGIAIDPRSTPSDVSVWVAHSSPVTNHGVVDTGMVTRLSGPALSVRQDVITGLPRSYANHGPNNLHFGPDGRLYLAVGGSTGAGSPNTAGSEFGERGEQALSAALVVADVMSPGFDGSCQNTADMYGPAPCDVTPFATGLRNTYDFVHHSNGHIYGTDNGLGVVGSFPPLATPPCGGFGDVRPVAQGGDNPGSQNDEINLLEEGRYYGHPNPARDECVFKDGALQGVPAPATYTAPVHDSGLNRSSNGIVEYSGDAFCGLLDGALLYGNYSFGDDIVALTVSPDGRTVTRSQTVVSGLADPLPLAVGPDGAIWVGEFGGGSITALVPRETGCWDGAAPAPVELLDAGGASVGNKTFVVGGKNGTGHLRSLYIHDHATGGWSRGPDLPGVGVENPAVAISGTTLYVMGGSTGPLDGAVSAAYALDTTTMTWTALPPMSTPRGGAAAVAVAGEIWVAGGMSATGASLASVEMYRPATGSWVSRPSLTVRRDNPGLTAVGDTLYVVGGRTRDANGTTPAQGLASMEVLTPGATAWTPGPDLPTGRRTVGAVAAEGRVLVMGGEGRSDGLAYDVVEAFDPAAGSWSRLRSMPTGRHGAVWTVVEGRVHAVGGGPVGGFSTSTAHEVFTPPWATGGGPA